MNGPSEVFFADVLEASAYTVMVVTMAGKQHAPDIVNTGDGYNVIMKNPIPDYMHEAIIQGIAHDKKMNPLKWQKTRENLNHGTEDVQ